MALFFSALLCGSLFLFAFLVWTRPEKGNATANGWLGIFLFSVTMLSLDSCLIDFDIYSQAPHLIGITDLFVFAMAPSFYLSVRHFTTPRTAPLHRQWLHFVPVLLLFLLQLPFYLESTDAKREVLQLDSPTGGFDPLFIIILIQLAIYLGLSLQYLHRHQRNIRLFSSNIQTIDLKWLQNAAYGIVFLVVVWIGEAAVPFFESFSMFGYLAGVYYLAHFALNQRAIFPFSQQVKAEIAEIIETTQEPKLEKRKILPDDALDLQKTRLLQWIETQKPYLNNELSLPSLAQQLQLSTNELSYLLNEGFGENFYQLINRYRVEESKRLLISPAHVHLSMLGIAYEAGFNSKTVFNTNFKKATGLSPSAYRTENSKQ